VLELDSLSVRYGGVDAVRNLSLIAPTPGAIAILGPNGAGKTSTLRAISGLVRHEGKITSNGILLSGRRPGTIAKLGVIHVPEGRRVFGSLNVEENLLVGSIGARGRARSFTLDDTYDLFPALVALRHRSAWALSGGEQQMLAIGRALVASPEVLLLDEPSLGLAPAIVERIYATFRQLKDRIGLVLVEQTAMRALDLVDDVVVLRDGDMVGHGAPSSFQDQGELARMMLGI
jgi:branched-chain amino acid transport system ATP-binding protein